MKNAQLFHTPDKTNEQILRLLPQSPLAGRQGKGGTIILNSGRTVTISSGTFRQILGVRNMPYDELHTMLREVKRADRTCNPERRTQHLARAAQMLAEATERYLASVSEE